MLLRYDIDMSNCDIYLLASALLLMDGSSASDSIQSCADDMKSSYEKMW
jgi:hypothetical protein